MKEKRSIIPEDNDIFGTRGLENKKKNTQKPRKIQEDGIPVIKRMEEKDNVKDIMVNNYATNDDDYYNRPPIGKPKARRIKRNTINNNNNTNTNNNKNNDLENKLNNYEEPKNKMTSSKIRKNNNDYNNDNDFNSNSNNDDNYNNNYYNFNKLRNYNKGNQNVRNSKGKITTTSVGIFPSQIKGIINEKEVLDLESKLYNLQKERDIVNDEYLKFPEYPKKREEINAKKKLEIKLEEMNKEISLQKLKIRELKEQNK